ncbi:MAG: succinate dehydrogenase, hydrophobic membrane anchor protein [Gammaproteobacteria bacterium]|nr:succinate dehydrogenase, hydrophobic membrane anchor protein [Gammaproteobacteria bacterium]MDD9825147.1 succinate dehydrogenase, hydrophobic membrane anchor protein [Gammaproteobacteria bacterium]MDD9863570.1 succinate dehydrogenase, hydrophobic membrane anchor protein [Gammaproteobacteria bacterium]
MSLRTPLGRAQGLGTAKSGLHHWWLQRLTAIALAPLSLWFALAATHLLHADYYATVSWVADPLNACLLIIFLVALYYHALLGMQVVVEDYSHGPGEKLVCLVILRLLFLFVGITAVLAVLKVALGG